jgi:hypothetical protein
MTVLVRPTPGSGDIQYGEWIGRIALALIFLFVPLLIIAGRVLRIAAGIALVVGWPERVASICGGLCFVAFPSIPSLPSHIAEIHAPASR